MSDNKEIVGGTPPTAQKSFWLEMGEEAVKETRNRQEDAAKQIITITSVLQAIYFATISFSDLKKVIVTQDVLGSPLIIVVALFVSPIIIWLIGLGFAVRVIVPVTYYAYLESPDQLKEGYIEAVRFKSKYLGRAHKALVLGFVAVVMNIVVYLVWTS